MENKICFDFFIKPSPLIICDYSDDIDDTSCYCVQNVSGLQVCFDGVMTSKNFYDEKKCTPTKFPVELFVGKKEADEVELIFGGVKVVLICAQNKYTNENFEEVLYGLQTSI
ncbi:MAG: putative orfan [Satyrvirus sp.]|uniref:Putative orfan n=1 Tax=Satyrvirus sp. TaxID=2487771 RepID=A0A3G5AEI5_9VIRU|nr:MAG: putative orfan [Satyrvirus sp.]